MTDDIEDIDDSPAQSGAVPAQSGKQMRGPTHQYERLFALGDTKLYSIQGYLVNGMPPKKLAKMIQEEWGDITDVGFETLAKQLQRYRDNTLTPKIATAVARAEDNRGGYYDAVRKFAGNIDVIQEQRELLALQKARVAKLTSHEAPMPALMGNLKGEMHLQHILQEGLYKMEMGVGIRRKPAQSVAGTFTLDESSGKIAFEAEIKNADEVREVTANVLRILNQEYIEDAEFTEDVDE